MYSIKTITNTIKVKSGENINNIIKLIKEKFEKKILCSHNVFIIDVLDINKNDLKNGIIDTITASINYDFEMNVLIFEPIIGNIIDSKVFDCNDLGIWLSPLHCEEYKDIIYIVIPVEFLNDYKYNKNGYYVFKNENLKKVVIGSVVKIKILNRLIENNVIKIVGILQ